MITIKTIDQLDLSSMNNKDVFRILASRKKYLIKVEGEYSMTNDYVQRLVHKYPNVQTDLVEVYELN